MDFSCEQCGGNSFTLDEAADDSSDVHCRDCGFMVGTLGKLRALLAAQLLGRKAE
jgi:hypothetical protein